MPQLDLFAAKQADSKANQITSRPDILPMIYPNGGNNPAVIVFHEDPGHGWLEVPIKLLKELGISKKITGYSYQKKDVAFLEEDCDLSTFFQAIGIGYKKDETEYQKDLRQLFWEAVPKRHQDRTPIRNYAHYKA